MVNRQELSELIRGGLEAVLVNMGGCLAERVRSEFDLCTFPLFGRDGMLTSIMLVSFVCEVEMAIEERYNLCVSLVSERRYPAREVRSATFRPWNSMSLS
jgi:hypothetical protein